MVVLFNQHWDVAPGKMQAYSDFVMTHYNPTLDRLGVKLVGGYYVTVGMGPRIIAVGRTYNLRDLEQALSTGEFADVTNRLQEYVTHYHSKIMVPTGRVPMDGYEVQTGLWKFNQYWNIVPGAEQEYAKFVKEELLPGMKDAGIPLTAGWRVIVGAGPYIVAESSAPTIVDIAKSLDTDAFRRVVRKLKTTYVTDYHSRILHPTGRVDFPNFMKSMMESF